MSALMWICTITTSGWLLSILVFAHQRKVYLGTTALQIQVLRTELHRRDREIAELRDRLTEVEQFCKKNHQAS
jgi:hypothetical protein